MKNVLVKMEINIGKGGEFELKSTYNYTFLGMKAKGNGETSGNINDIAVKSVEYITDLQTAQTEGATDKGKAAARRFAANFGIKPETFDKLCKILNVEVKK